MLGIQTSKGKLDESEYPVLQKYGIPLSLSAVRNVICELQHLSKKWPIVLESPQWGKDNSETLLLIVKSTDDKKLQRNAQCWMPHLIAAAAGPDVKIQSWQSTQHGTKATRLSHCDVILPNGMVKVPLPRKFHCGSKMRCSRKLV